ncbi:MAG: hypothetical protein ABIU54_11315, partial [Candidatus Eisenbacteria bacterium]
QHVARGYTHAGGKSVTWRDNVATRPARGSAAGGSYSTVTDLLAFDQALVQAKLGSVAWSEWATGGPRPDRSSGTGEHGEPGFGFAGGAPGIASDWTHEGDRTLIVLTNVDPQATQRTMESLRAILQRMSRSTP